MILIESLLSSFRTNQDQDILHEGFMEDGSWPSGTKEIAFDDLKNTGHHSEFAKLGDTALAFISYMLEGGIIKMKYQRSFKGDPPKIMTALVFPPKKKFARKKDVYLITTPDSEVRGKYVYGGIHAHIDPSAKTIQFIHGHSIGTKQEPSSTMPIKVISKIVKPQQAQTS